MLPEVESSNLHQSRCEPSGYTGVIVAYILQEQLTNFLLYLRPIDEMEPMPDSATVAKNLRLYGSWA